VTSVNSRLAEILADYASAIADIERPPTSPRPEEADRRLLRPADKQRACRPPTIAPTV
jgi:hypothetical protein